MFDSIMHYQWLIQLYKSTSRDQLLQKAFWLNETTKRVCIYLPYISRENLGSLPVGLSALVLEDPLPWLFSFCLRRINRRRKNLFAAPVLLWNSEQKNKTNRRRQSVVEVLIVLLILRTGLCMKKKICDKQIENTGISKQYSSVEELSAVSITQLVD